MNAQNYARPELLVETDWLEERLNDTSIRVVDCDEYDKYRRAHIKNALGIRVHHYVKHPDYPKDPTGHPLVADPDTFVELMGSMGIGNDDLVVAYDNAGGLYATRFWWVLSYYGHTNVKVLNGGWRKWFDEGRPATLEVPDLSADRSREGYTVTMNQDVVCTLDHGVASVGRSDTVFLDVRSDGEWDGTNDRGNKRAGRVPGAVHLEWLNLITDDDYRTFRPAHELRAMLDELGVTPEKQIIPY